MSNTVYTTAQSAVYHQTADCRGLKRANEVHATRQRDCELYFRKNPCYLCFPRNPR